MINDFFCFADLEDGSETWTRCVGDDSCTRTIFHLVSIKSLSYRLVWMDLTAENPEIKWSFSQRWGGYLSSPVNFWTCGDRNQWLYGIKWLDLKLRLKFRSGKRLGCDRTLNVLTPTFSSPALLVRGFSSANARTFYSTRSLTAVVYFQRRVEMYLQAYHGAHYTLDGVRWVPQFHCKSQTLVARSHEYTVKKQKFSVNIP